MRYLSNAFSIQMLPDGGELRIETVDLELVKVHYNSGMVKSVIGHADLANVLSRLLGRKVEQNRESITLQAGDTLYVAQLTGGRLPEGATALPDGFSLQFYVVTVEHPEQFRPWPHKFDPQSEQGQMFRFGQDLADWTHGRSGGRISPRPEAMQDAWGNFHVVLTDPRTSAFYADIHDD